MVSRYDSYVYSSSRIAVVRDSERVVARTKKGKIARRRNNFLKSRMSVLLVGEIMLYNIIALLVGQKN